MPRPLSPFMFIALAAGCILVTWISAFISQENNPAPVKQPVAIVQTTLPPGYSTEVTARQVTFVIEKALGSLEGVDELKSVSTGKTSTVSVFAKADAATDELFYKIREQVSTARRLLPSGIDPPSVIRAYSDQPSFFYILRHKNSGTGLHDVNASELIPEIERLPEVSFVHALGGSEPAIRICPHDEKLKSIGLNRRDLMMQFESANASAGIIAASSVPVKINYQNTDELLNALLDGNMHQRVRLRDVCSIEKTTAPVPSFCGISGRLQPVGGLIFCKSTENKSELQQKLAAHINAYLGKHHRSIEVDFIHTDSTTLQEPVSFYDAVLVPLVCFVCLFIAGFFARMPTKNKAFIIAFAGILLFLPLLMLNSEKEPGEKNIHFAVSTYGTPSIEQKQALAFRLETSIKRLKGVKQVSFYQNSNHADPFEKQKIHFYATLEKNVDPGHLLSELRSTLAGFPGIAVTEFPGIQGTLKIQGDDFDDLLETARLFEEKFNHEKDLLFYTKGLSIHPEYVFEMKNAVDKGISKTQLNALLNPVSSTVLIGGKPMNISFDCNDWEYLERMHVRSMYNGELIPVTEIAQLVKTATIDAIYHENGKMTMKFGFFMRDKREAESVKQMADRFIYGSNTLKKGVVIRWEE